MADALDEEIRFRSPLLDASTKAIGIDRLLGQFDRHTFVLWLSAEVASSLDRQGGTLPSYSVELPDTPSMRGFSTHLHETIHFWQSVGSTSGLIYALGDATAAFSTMDDLVASGHRRKPILQTLPKDAAHDNPALRACLCWSDIEHGCAMLDDPARTVERLRQHRGSFVSLGQSLLSLCANTSAGLGAAFDPKHVGLVDPEPWLDAYERFVAEERSGFDRESIVQVPIGMRELAEGQARISEIQHRDLTQQAVSWEEVKARGWLHKVYGRAFELYLQLAELPEPKSPRDDTVNLFLLLCDIAINPAVGYADPIDPAKQFVHDFHPGVRFMRLCRAVLKDPGLLRTIGAPSLATYDTLSRRLCDAFEWKTPTEVASTLLERWANSAKGAELAEQHETRDYGSADLHRRFVIGEHRSFLETKSQIPHFFCWPAWAVLVFNDDLEYAANIDQVLGWHRPPFTAEEDCGVTTVEIQRLSTDQAPQFLSDYFATLALYDLSRQWIAKPRAFVWDRFNWKQPLTPVDIERLKDRFSATFSVALDSIEVP